MEAAAHDPGFAKKMGIPQSVAREYAAADQAATKPPTPHHKSHDAPMKTPPRHHDTHDQPMKPKGGTKGY